MKDSARKLWKLYVPHISKIPLEKGITWEPTWKETPILDSYLSKYVQVQRIVKFSKPNKERVMVANAGAFIPSNIFTNLKHELAAYAWNEQKIHSFQDGYFSPGILWYHRVLYAGDIKRTTQYSNMDLEYYERSIGPHIDSLLPAYETVPLFTGRLCQTLAGAGKRRIFAICNYVKQRLVHQWAFAVLRGMRTDGTFSQEAPLVRLRDRKEGVGNNIYSFDLKSATDRWPLSVIYTMFESLFGPTFASSVVNSSLGLNNFLVGKPLTKKQYNISFTVGQPLGYKGSWSLFALSHHFVVWCAAHRADPNRTAPFLDYALLGDDIVIADSQVAEHYQQILSQLGVQISRSKSIISNNGSCEFGKRFWVDKLQKNLSPISLKALTDCRSLRGLATLREKYNIEKISVLQRLGGAGYRVRSRLMTTQSIKWERLKVVVSKPIGSKSLPLDFWLGRGYPLNPYLKAKMVTFLRREMKPKEIKIFPQDLTFDGEREILERTVLRNWMSQWLKYVSWYYTKAMSENVSIQEFFDAPICSGSWKRSQRDETLVRWGHLWKLYDMGIGWDISVTPRPMLSPMIEPVTGLQYLLLRERSPNPLVALPKKARRHLCDQRSFFTI